MPEPTPARAGLPSRRSGSAASGAYAVFALFAPRRRAADGRPARAVWIAARRPSARRTRNSRPWTRLWIEIERTWFRLRPTRLVAEHGADRASLTVTDEGDRRSVA